VCPCRWNVAFRLKGSFLYFYLEKKNNNKIFLSILAERKERQLNFCISETWETKKKNGIPPLLSTSIVHEKKMCVLVTSISKSKKKNPASFSNVTFPACFIFPVQCDPRIAERSDERNVSGERERDIFFRRMFYTYGMSFLIFSVVRSFLKENPAAADGCDGA
jgi:hypothetical protein